MTHNSKEMWDLVTAYCLAVKTLIKNPTARNRRWLALDAMKQYGKKEVVTPLISQYLQEAQ